MSTVEIEETQALKFDSFGFLNRSSERPLAEPPILDYDDVIDYWKIPCDARLKRLLPNDPALRTKLRDQETEIALSWEYLCWAESRRLAEAGEGRAARIKFYRDLMIVLHEDWQREISLSATHVSVPDLARDGVISRLAAWEYKYLDDDGGTKGVEALLAKGEDVFGFVSGGRKWEDEEAKKKYGHLAPRGHFEKMQRNRAEWNERRRVEVAVETKPLVLQNKGLSFEPKCTIASTKRVGLVAYTPALCQPRFFRIVSRSDENRVDQDAVD